MAFQSNIDVNTTLRHIHPSIYKKLRKTKKLWIQRINPFYIRSKGGLDPESFAILEKRWHDQDREIQRLDKGISKSYGGYQKVPKSSSCLPFKNKVAGTKNTLVLLIEFPDLRHTYSSEYFNDLFFKKMGCKSVRDYFLEVSGGTLDINGEVSPWLKSKKKHYDYRDTDLNFTNARKLVYEALSSALKGYQINIRQFAPHGKVELLLVVFAGPGADTTLNFRHISPHASKFQPCLNFQGITFERYCIVPELFFDQNTHLYHGEGVGCYCHEISHLLGLMDHYKCNYSPIVGSWCLMAIGDHNNDGKTPAHLCAWCKTRLGWVEPVEVKGRPKRRSIPAVINPPHVIYKIEVGSSRGKEYFLLENRQKIGFDSHLPSSGLLIWHVNEKACKFPFPNNDPNNFFLTLEQSDGRYELERNQTEFIRAVGQKRAEKDIEGDEGDPFPGNTTNRTFDFSTSPNNVSVIGQNSGVVVTSISDSQEIMTAVMGINNPNSQRSCLYHR